jgi:hypothetical protein
VYEGTKEAMEKRIWKGAEAGGKGSVVGNLQMNPQPER